MQPIVKRSLDLEREINDLLMVEAVNHAIESACPGLGRVGYGDGIFQDMELVGIIHCDCLFDELGLRVCWSETPPRSNIVQFEAYCDPGLKANHKSFPDLYGKRF